MFINSYDMARFGYPFLQNGKWKDRQIVSERWMKMAQTPGPDNDSYGYARALRPQRLQHHVHRLGQRSRGRLPVDPRRTGARRRDRQDHRLDEHTGDEAYRELLRAVWSVGRR